MSQDKKAWPRRTDQLLLLSIAILMILMIIQFPLQCHQKLKTPPGQEPLEGYVKKLGQTQEEIIGSTKTANLQSGVMFGQTQEMTMEEQSLMKLPKETLKECPSQIDEVHEKISE